MQLKEWAAVTGVSYATARRRYESGTLLVPTYRLGRLIMVGEPVTGAVAEAGQVVVYACVSSVDRKADLDRQVARVTTWATGQRLTVSRVVTEVGSALDVDRKRLMGLLQDPAVSTIAVERRDRSPGSGLGTLKRPSLRRAGVCWSSILLGSMTIWSGAWPRC